MLFNAYQKGVMNLERLFQLIFGDQDVPENAHLSGLTKDLVIKHLESLGMEIVDTFQDGGWDIRITASKGKLDDSLNLDHPDYQFR